MELKDFGIGKEDTTLLLETGVLIALALVFSITLCLVSFVAYYMLKRRAPPPPPPPQPTAKFRGIPSDTEVTRYPAGGFGGFPKDYLPVVFFDKRSFPPIRPIPMFHEALHPRKPAAPDKAHWTSSVHSESEPSSTTMGSPPPSEMEKPIVKRCSSRARPLQAARPVAQDAEQEAPSPGAIGSLLLGLAASEEEEPEDQVPAGEMPITPKTIGAAILALAGSPKGGHQLRGDIEPADLGDDAEGSTVRGILKRGEELKMAGFLASSETMGNIVMALAGAIRDNQDGAFQRAEPQRGLAGQDEGPTNSDAEALPEVHQSAVKTDAEDAGSKNPKVRLYQKGDKPKPETQWS